MQRPERLNLIRKLLATRQVASQSALRGLLKSHGVSVTQPTLSRDLIELNVAKSPEGYMISEADSCLSTVSELLPSEILDIRHNESMLLIQTMIGRASGVAWYLDMMGFPEILGTIAGDDQVLVIPRSVKKINATLKRLERLRKGQAP